MYVYIHGFNSNLQSRSYKDLSRILPHLYDCGYDYTKKADTCYEELCVQIEKCIKENAHKVSLEEKKLETRKNLLHIAQEDKNLAVPSLKLLGSSLGGFWALHLAEKYELPCLAFNPVTFAHEQLRPFLGLNENFYTKQKWEFTEEILKSYAPYCFTRSRTLKATLIIGKNDEILDPKIAQKYWEKHAKCLLTKDQHSILNYEKYKDIIFSFWKGYK